MRFWEVQKGGGTQYYYIEVIAHRWGVTDTGSWLLCAYSTSAGGHWECLGFESYSEGLQHSIPTLRNAALLSQGRQRFNPPSRRGLGPLWVSVGELCEIANNWRGRWSMTLRTDCDR
jgi:hypothetical protein